MLRNIAPQDVQSIGAVSDHVSEFLEHNGPVTLSKLARGVRVPRDLVMQALGWLARDGRIEFLEGERSKLVSLRPLVDCDFNAHGAE